MPDPTTTQPACEGCRRAALYPRHTLRFWALDEPDANTGRFMHADPSGSSWDCRDQGAGEVAR